MALVEFQDDDLKRGTLVDPGMYDVIVEHQEDSTDKNGFPLFKYRFKIINCPNPEFDGVRLFTQFSSKAMGFYVPFWTAVTGEKPTKGQGYDTSYPVGRTLRVQVIRDVYEGNAQNKVAGYAPLVG